MALTNLDIPSQGEWTVSHSCMDKTTLTIVIMAKAAFINKTSEGIAPTASIQNCYITRQINIPIEYSLVPLSSS